LKGSKSEMYFLTCPVVYPPLPKDFTDELSSLLPEDELEYFYSSLDLNPSLSIRVNPSKNIGLAPHLPVPWCSTGSYLKERPSFTLDPLFHAGAYYVQEASSMFLEQAVRHAVDISQPLKVLDLCAAPGGKSTHLLSLLSSQSLLVSNEVIHSRANILCENIQKWGHPNVVVTQSDPKSFNHLKGFFDLIVLDAPCSGEGLFRKEPESLTEWSSANVELCSQRQKRILADVFPSLKENGILIYCTCTYNRKENEENLRWLSNEFEIEFVSVPIQKEWRVQEVSENGICGYRFFPHKVQGEGFFLSVIRKHEKEQGIKMKRQEIDKVSNKILDRIKPWIKNSLNYNFISRNENIVLIPESFSEEIIWLGGQLHMLQAGITMGSLKHEKIIPAHALALSTVLDSGNTQLIELSNTEALQYFRKETFELPRLKMGYSLATFSGLGLGWINGLGHRFNNLYPTNWRIRMK